MIERLGSEYRVAELLPHGPGMVLLDELVEYGHDYARCALTVRPDTPFLEAEGVPSWVGIEYMAQTIAAYAGIQCVQRGHWPRIGLLLGARTYDCRADRFSLGSRLVTRAEAVIDDPGGVSVFACELGDGHAVWARSEIRAFQPADVEAYLHALTEDQPS